MNTKQFIKVTPKDGKKPFVIPAQNKSFYISQGAEITEPTKDEVLEAFPELVEKKDGKKQDQSARIAELEKAVAERDETIAQLQTQIEQLTAPADAQGDSEAPVVDESPADAPSKRGGKKKE